MAEESSSIELTAADITSALGEIDAVFDYIENYGKSELEGDNFHSNNETDNLDFELLTLENLAKVKGLCSLVNMTGQSAGKNS